ncbi:WGR domain-containing protein [Sphingobium sp. B1D7B]|uniref:WGR domain-containing protein n=1 Tax=Sphingobium sp. B1D7B TaxID=2940578 RepID=UPI002223F483|nr:WGR domain-containing protein [Sphingobium sp. B1D7B]
MLDADDQLIRLQAVDLARNIARRYEIHVQRDLFGAIVVDYSWGRIGAAGQARRVSFDDDDRGARFVRQLLARRETATARIGVAYRRV